MQKIQDLFDPSKQLNRTIESVVHLEPIQSKTSIRKYGNM